MPVTKAKVLKCISSKRLGGRSIYPGVYSDPHTLDLLFNTLGVPKVLEKDATPATLVVVLEGSDETIKPAAVAPETVQMVQVEETIQLTEKVEKPACENDPCECEDKENCTKDEQPEPKRRGRRRKSEE